MQSILEYQDYRQYLVDVYQREKESSNLTLAKFAKRLNFSASLLKMIMDGQRKLSSDKIHAVAKSMHFSDHEWSYFESLVRLNDADTEEEIQFYKHRLSNLNDTKSVQKIRTDKAEILLRWYMPALLIYLIDYAKVENGELVYDQQRLCAQLQLSSVELRELIENLQTTGLLKLKSEGGVQIVFDKILGNLKKQRYAEDVLQEIRKQVRSSFDKDNRVFVNSVMSLNRSQIGEFKKEFRELVAKYSAAEVGENGQVIQTFLGMFPVI